MPPTVVLVVLLLTWGCSILVQSSSEHTEANSTDSSDGGEVKLRVTRSDVRSTLAGKVEPGFWPARGRRGDPDELILPLITTKGGRLKYAVHGADLKDLIDLWKEEADHPNTLRLRRQEPLYADEPNYTLLGRRDEAEILEKDGEASMVNPDDPFWVARGRRRLDRTMPIQSRLASDEDDTFWAARGRRAPTRGLHNLISAEEPFWAARGRRSESFEEPFWPARGKKKSSSFTLEDFRNRRGFLSQGEEPFWAARGKKSGEKRSRIPLMDALSSGEPFWAARGRRGLLESLSSEEPFWAARGKKNSGLPLENPIKQMLPRENIPNSSADPWWPVRGKRVADESFNPEDEHFWNTLDSKTKSNKAS